MISETRVNEAIQLFARAAGLSDLWRIRRWEELGLTVPQLRVLFFLQQEPNAPAGAIAQHLEVTPSTVTGLVDRLVRIRLVRRVEDSSDRRIVRATLTEEGMEAVAGLNGEGHDRMAEVFRAMDPKKVQDLVRALEDLIRASRAPVRPDKLAG